MPEQPPPSVPAGWYPDADGGGQRWWDGSSWTDARLPAERPAPAPEAAASTPPSSMPTMMAGQPPPAPQPARPTPVPAPAPAPRYAPPSPPPATPRSTAQPSSSGGRGTLVAIVVVVVLVLAGAGVGAFLLLGGDDDSESAAGNGGTGQSGELSADGVVVNYFTGVRDGRCSAIDLLTVEEAQDEGIDQAACEAAGAPAYFASPELADCVIELKEAEPEGDDFTAVRVQVTGCADPAVTEELDDSTFDVRLIDGSWQLDEAFVPLSLDES